VEITKLIIINEQWQLASSRDFETLCRNLRCLITLYSLVL